MAVATNKKTKLVRTSTEKPNVDFVNISNGTHNKMRISSYSPFFENELVVTWRKDALVLRVAGLDDVKRQKATKQKDSYTMLVYGECVTGIFDFDKEESNEDRKIIYFPETT